MVNYDNFFLNNSVIAICFYVSSAFLYSLGDTP